MEKVSDAPMIRSLLLLNKCAHYDVRTWKRFETLGLPPEAFIEDSPSIWDELDITERNKDVMSRALSFGWVDRELETCGRLGVRLVTFADALFPPALLKIKNPPLLLYVKGNMPPAENKTIAVVGTRRCSVYGERTARAIGTRAAERGWNVISGGAKGIDGAAHAGCLESGGITAALLGTGVDVVYPSEHAELFSRILDRGALCSEFSLGEKGESWHFPRRNRIIVGFASKIVIVEAPHKSGGMITAGLAAEEGREVWSVPGRIDDERCAGSNRLIFDGAMPLVDFELLFGSKSQYAETYIFTDEEMSGSQPAGQVPAGPERKNLTDGERKILSLLAIHPDNTIDNLANEAKMGAAEVFNMITVMSLRGLVFSSGPGRYSSCD
ncbi:MAG: DNA-processing protein DprA [Synergistaceae bacterium]|jgi:DNA processing protein|nr:DNA-processing protein DprA [Synergistaceae bacterium]